MKTKKEKPKLITAEYFQDKMYIENEDITDTEMMIAFARLKVKEALEETAKHFKNPENISYIKNHYNLDKIV